MDLFFFFSFWLEFMFYISDVFLKKHMKQSILIQIVRSGC